MDVANVGRNSFFQGMYKGIKNAIKAKTQDFILKGVVRTLPRNQDVLNFSSEVRTSYMQQLFNTPIRTLENPFSQVDLSNILQKYKHEDAISVLKSFIALSNDMVENPDNEFNYKKIFDNKEVQKLICELLDTDSVIVGKFAQIVSDNKQIMSILQPQMQQKIREKLSHNAATYSNEEVVDIAKQLLIRENTYDANCDVQVKKLNAGTVGEAWIVTISKNTYEVPKNYVLKLIKKGITKEKIEKEKNFIVNLLGGENLPATKEYVDMLENLTKNWIAELDLTQEVKNNKELAQGCKYFKVATAFSATFDGQAIVEDFASGIPAEKIIGIVEDYFYNYKNDIDGFREKYENEIKTMPELKNPQKFSATMVENLTYALVDMMIYLKNDKNVLHGNPHGGNFFIEPKTLLPIFIDTGNCIERNYDEALNDLKFFIAYFVGDTQKMAEYYANMCNIQDEFTINRLNLKIKEKIFYKGNNITNFTDVLTAINQIAKDENFIVPPEKTTALKAQAQLTNIIHKFEIISGKKSFSSVLKCLPEVLKRKNFRYNDIKDIIKGIFSQMNSNPELSCQTAFQFI